MLEQTDDVEAAFNIGFGNINAAPSAASKAILATIINILLHREVRSFRGMDAKISDASTPA